MRRPSWQFYPADWQANPKLRRCSHAEKGIWLDVLCILHDQDEYGIVRWPLADLARAINARLTSLQSLVTKGVLKGAEVNDDCQAFVYVSRHGRKDGEPVTLIESQPGPLWYSSRMVRDEYVRSARAANDPSPKLGIGETFGVHPTPHPSRARVSSSSSSSTKDKDPADAAKPILEQFKDLVDFKSRGKDNGASFLGLQIKTYGRDEVEKAAAVTVLNNAEDPVAYITRVLDGMGRKFVSQAEMNSAANKRLVI